MTDPQYAETIRRAEILERIIEFLATTTDLPPLGRVLPMVSPPRQDGPRIAVYGQRVLCDGQSLDLSRRPLTLKVFKLFLQAQDYALSVDGIIIGLYGPAGEGRSRRMQESMRVNAVKAVSRARLAALEGFGDDKGVEWFAHDRGRWFLYRLAPCRGPGEEVREGSGDLQSSINT